MFYPATAKSWGELTRMMLAGLLSPEEAKKLVRKKASEKLANPEEVAQGRGCLPPEDRE